MGIAVEALFTSALGLQPPWVVDDVRLDTAKRRIDFEIGCHTSRLACPACGAATQPVHDRLRRSWRHLDFFQFEAWLHCEVPRVACGPAARPRRCRAVGASGLGLHRGVRGAGADLVPGAAGAPGRRVAALQGQAAVAAHRVLRRAGACAGRLRRRAHVGIDETSLRRGQHYITVVHDLDRQAACCSPPRGASTSTVVEFAEDLKAHGGDPPRCEHVCIDMSAAYAKGVALALPKAQISYDRFHVIAMANDAMDQVRREEMRTDAQAVREAAGRARQARRSGSCCGACGATRQLERPPVRGDALAAALDAQERTGLAAEAWRCALVYARRHSNSEPSNRPHPTKGLAELGAALRLEPFKKLAATLKERFGGGVVRGMLDRRSNA
jgi:transposase